METKTLKRTSQFRTLVDTTHACIPINVNRNSMTHGAVTPTRIARRQASRASTLLSSFPAIPIVVVASDSDVGSEKGKRETL